jgi:hypothetical protein
MSARLIAAVAERDIAFGPRLALGWRHINLDARRERVTIVSGDVGKLFDQSGVGQVKVLHTPDMGVNIADVICSM